MKNIAANLLILCFTVLEILVDGSLYSSNSDVINLDPSNFDDFVLQSDNVWLVEFYAPWCGHCKKLVPEYIKAAMALKGVIKVGAVNADEHGALGDKYSIQGFPTIKVFGIDKTNPDDYNGQRTAHSIVNNIFDILKNKVKIQMSGKTSDRLNFGKEKAQDVIELTDANFDSLVMNSNDLWLVDFFAPWCTHCLNLAPQWAQAATVLKGKVKFGALDATVHKIKAYEYQVKSYPKIKAFPVGKKDHDSVIDYTRGGRSAKDIVDWALQHLAETVPAPTVDQIINDTVLKSACENHSLCVVAVLPHILDCPANCRNAFINILNKLGEKYRKQTWGWAWSDAGAQPELEKALEIDGFNYPALAVINAKKMKYSSLRGSFSFDGINEFLRHLAFGRGSALPVKDGNLPIIFTVKPWDGTDGVMPPQDINDLGDTGIDENKDEL